MLLSSPNPLPTGRAGPGCGSSVYHPTRWAWEPGGRSPGCSIILYLLPWPQAVSSAGQCPFLQSSPVAPSPPPSFCALMTQPPSQSWLCNLGSCSYPLRLLHAASFLSKASVFTKLLTQNSLFKSSGFFYAMRPNGLSCSNSVERVLDRQGAITGMGDHFRLQVYDK